MNVNLELTDHCNLRCRMCSQSLRDEAHGVPERFMPFEVWQAALEGLAGLPDVDLCPHWLGEPTLHPHFDRFVEHAFAANAGNRLFRHFKLHTNAVQLSPERAERLVRLARSPAVAPDTFRAVHFSVDAVSAPTYLAVKGKDRRDQVYRNIATFLDLRARAPRPVVHLAFVVQQENHHEAAAFVRHWGTMLTRLGRRWNLTSDWPPFDADAVYLRRLNTGDQARADRLHAEVCRQVGVPVGGARPPGSF